MTIRYTASALLSGKMGDNTTVNGPSTKCTVMESSFPPIRPGTRASSLKAKKMALGCTSGQMGGFLKVGGSTANNMASVP